MPREPLAFPAQPREPRREYAGHGLVRALLRFRDQWRCDGFIRVMLDSREALMSVVELIQTIESLTPQQQEAVSAFVHYLKNPKTPAGSPFVHAAEEFMDEHPELMRLLAN